MEKIVDLKNNLIVKIKTEDYFHLHKLYAYDEQGNNVGMCTITIKKTFSRSLSEEQKIVYSRVHKIDSYQVPTEREITVGACDSNSYMIEGDTLTFLGKDYKLKNAICHINKIEVLNEKYYKVGLGYNLLKYAEDIAKQYNCSQIEGFYYPDGQFQFGTLDFYKRNGFSFEKRYGNMPYIYKPLLEKVQEKTL